jgi:PIN domain nuclease of toxin-antitoxin system
VPRQLHANGFQALPIRLEHALRVHRLPDYHRDPFDRLLIAQALEGGLTLVTADAQMARYPVRTLW